jgi:uncharacterized protein
MPMISVELIYASAVNQDLLCFQVTPGTTVAQLIALAALHDLPTLEGNVGIFARPCKLSDTLKNGDRVEIYRPLIADPKHQRRERAERSKRAL